MKKNKGFKSCHISYKNGKIDFEIYCHDEKLMKRKKEFREDENN